MLPALSISDLRRAHPSWIANEPAWREIESVRRNVRAEMMGHLVRGALESDREWEKRGKLLRFAPECIVARHGFVGQVMDMMPNRDRVPQALREWAQKVDRFGRSLTDWVEQRALPLAVDFGASFAFVDSPRLAITPRNRAEEVAAGGDAVLLTSYGPLSVRNWSVDAQGRIEWVVIVEDVARAAVPAGPRVPQRRYIVLDHESFLVVHTKAKEGGPVPEPTWDVSTGDSVDDAASTKNIEEEVDREEGVHTCGAVPLVPFIIDPEHELIGRSLIRNSVQIDLRRLNHESDQDGALHLHGHPQLVLKSKSGPRDIGVGNEHCIQINPDNNDELGYLELPATSFEQRRAEITQARADIHRHAGGDPMAIADSTAGNASGRARQVSARNSIGRHVKRVRTGLASFENGILALAGMKRGVEFDPMAQGVTYPVRFLQETDMEVIETTGLAKKNTRSETAKVELELRMLDTVLPGLATDVRTKITKEVRETPSPAPMLQLFGNVDADPSADDGDGDDDQQAAEN